MNKYVISMSTSASSPLRNQRERDVYIQWLLRGGGNRGQKKKNMRKLGKVLQS